MGTGSFTCWFLHQPGPQRHTKKLGRRAAGRYVGPCWCQLEVLVSNRGGSSGGASCPTLPLCMCTKRSCFRIPHGELIWFPSESATEEQRWVKPCGSLLGMARALVTCGSFLNPCRHGEGTQGKVHPCPMRGGDLRPSLSAGDGGGQP